MEGGSTIPGGMSSLGTSLSRLGFPGGAGEEEVPVLRRNKVLRASLLLIGVSSGAEEGSVRSRYPGAVLEFPSAASSLVASAASATALLVSLGGGIISGALQLATANPFCEVELRLGKITVVRSRLSVVDTLSSEMCCGLVKVCVSESDLGSGGSTEVARACCSFAGGEKKVSKMVSVGIKHLMPGLRHQMPLQHGSTNILLPVHGDDPSNPLAGRAAQPVLPPHFQERLVSRRDEMRGIAADNTLVLEDILRLRQELALTEDEVRTLNKETIPTLLASKEMECRDIIQGGLKLEEEMRALEPVRAEVSNLRSEKMRLQACCEELFAKAESLYKELQLVQFERKQLPAMRAELHDLQGEVSRARVAYEYEQQAKLELLEQKRAMEGEYFNMKMEAERLQTELERRGRKPAGFKYNV